MTIGLNKMVSKTGRTGTALAAALLAAAGLSISVRSDAYVGMVSASNPTPKLHVTGKYLQDPNGHTVLLHGWYQAAQSWFNGSGNNYPDPTDYTNAANVAPALNFLNQEADVLSNTSAQYGYTHGWYSSFVRFNGSPGQFAPGWDATTGQLTDSAQFNGWIQNLLIPYVNHCRQNGLYVVIMGLPSEVYPAGNQNNNMTQQYQQNLIQFWKTLASTPGLKNVSNVQFEICNEPVNIETSFGADDWGSGDNAHWSALTNFMQPIVDAIRGQSADNVIWMPALGWQSQYQGYAAYPIKGGNIGYAAHFYPGYVGGDPNTTASVNTLWNNNYKPCADKYPVLITELWWRNYTAAEITANSYNSLFNAITGTSTYGFGTALKANVDAEGNVGYLIGMPSDLLANLDQAQSGSNWSAVTLAAGDGAQAAFNWYPAFAAGGTTPAVPTVPVGPAAGTYEISPADDSKLCAELYKGGSANGTRLDQNFWSGTANQKFAFHPLGDNLYWLEPQNALGSALEISGGYAYDGGVLDSYTSYGQSNQLWYVIGLGNGSYRIASDLNPNETLDQPGGSKAPDIRPTPATPLYLQTYTWHNGTNQQWKLIAR